MYSWLNPVLAVDDSPVSWLESIVALLASFIIHSIGCFIFRTDVTYRAVRTVMVYASAVGRIVGQSSFISHRSHFRLRPTGPLSGARLLAGDDAAEISRACGARARASVVSEASGTPLWLAAMRVAEGGDANAAVALVEALEPGSDEARSALSESRRSDEAEVEGTALWLASLAARNGVPGAVSLARALICAGAEPDARGIQGVAGDETTPLWWAAAAVEAGVPGALTLVQELVDAGADVDAEGTFDVVRGPPLWWAAVATRNGEEEEAWPLRSCSWRPGRTLTGGELRSNGSWGDTAGARRASRSRMLAVRDCAEFFSRRERG